MAATYVHCAGCKCAFDAATSTRCPSCQRRLGSTSVQDRVIEALDELERAMREATAADRVALDAALATRFPRALPVREVLALPPPRRRDPWVEAATAVVGRLARRARRMVAAFA